MSVATVIGCHPVGARELAGHGYSRKFLADAGVNGAIHSTLREQLQELLLHYPDEQRLADLRFLQTSKRWVRSLARETLEVRNGEVLRRQLLADAIRGTGRNAANICKMVNRAH